MNNNSLEIERERGKTIRVLNKDRIENMRSYIVAKRQSMLLIKNQGKVIKNIVH